MPPTPAPETWEDFARALGIELQRHRIQSGMAQEELAHRAGLSRTHYQQLERGEWKPGRPANPSLKTVIRLCQILETQPSELLPDSTFVDWPQD